MPRGLQERDDDGLLFEQRRYLDTLARTGSPKTAARAAGRTTRTIKRWMTEPHFKQMYDEMFSNTNEELTRRLDAAAEIAIDTFIEGLGAEEGEKTVPYTCDNCGYKGKAFIPKTDWRTRMRSAETVLKIKKLLVEKQEVEHTGVVGHLVLDMAERTALARWQAGYDVPQHLEQKFREYLADGLVKPPKQLEDPNVVEGEVREVKES